MSAQGSTADHITVAIEDIDSQVAALNAQIDQMRTRVDTLVDARVQLVHARTAVSEAATVPLDPAPAVAPPPAAPTAAPTEPAPTRAKKTRARKTAAGESKYDLGLVAEVAREAIRLGVSPKEHVADQIDECPSAQMGQYLISKARAAGHDIPKLRPGKQTATAQSSTEPAAATHNAGHPNAHTQNKPFVRPTADEVADLERQAGLA